MSEVEPISTSNNLPTYLVEEPIRCSREGCQNNADYVIRYNNTRYYWEVCENHTNDCVLLYNIICG